MTVSASPTTTRVAQLDFKDASGRPTQIEINGERSESYTCDVDPDMSDNAIATHWAESFAHQGRLATIKRTATSRERVVFTVQIEQDKA